MALDTYANLKTAIATLLNRDDMASAIGDFITMAEADMARKVRHWRMETNNQAFTIDGRFEDVPTDWLETVRLSLSTDPEQRLELVAIPVMQRYRRASALGKPRFYAHVGGQFEFYPVPDDAYTAELVYMAKAPALSDSTTSNWILDAYPDAYLYGAALHSAPYLRDDERIVIWAEFYRNAIDRMNESSDRAKWSGTGLRIRVR